MRYPLAEKILFIALALPLATLAIDSSQQFEHVIITSQELANSTRDYTLADLRDHRIAHGMSSTIVTVEYITANYPGRDDAEKVRNFIKDAHANWGTQYVLLGGDTGQVPHRIMYKNNVDTVQIASDLYFSCLDGSFDADGDGRFGEGPVDSCVYNYQVAVGRISGENVDEISHGVYKTIMAENTPRNASFLTKMMNVNQEAAGVGDTFSWSDKFTSRHRELSMEFYHATEFNKNAFLTRRLNNHNIGQYAWASHGNRNKLGDEFWNTTASGLTGADQFSFIHTLACLAGKFQEDCMAERLTTQNRNGGAFAVLFNSVNAFAGPDAMPPWVHTYFPETYYEKGITRMGDIRVDMGQNQDPTSNVNSRYTAYHHNLFGDPAVIWKQLYAISLANYWPLDNGQGTSCDDASGNGNPLTLSGGVLWTTNGIHGAALEFTGTGTASAPLNNWAPLSNFGEITLSAWVRPDTRGGNLVWKGDGSSSVFRLALDATGKLRFYANEGAPENQRGGSQSWTSNSALPLGQWTHVAVMFDKNPFSAGDTHGDAGTLKIYLNGALDVSSSVSMLYFGENAAPLLLGSGFDGALDDVRIYGRPLSPSELQCAIQNDLAVQLGLEDNLLDAGTFNNTASAAGGPQWINRRDSRALQFDGTDDLLEIAHSTSLEIERRLTLSAWINPSAYVDGAGIITKGNSTLPFGLMLTDSGKLRFEANRGSMNYASNSGTYESTAAIPLNQWTHIAATYNGETVQFYINGQTDAAFDAYLRFGDNTQPLYIGCEKVGTAAFFVGAIDEPTVYNRALTASEIDTLATPPAPEKWLDEQFGKNRHPADEDTVWGWNADADGDGLDNLCEYAFKSSPNAYTPVNPTTGQLDNGYLCINYRQRTGGSGTIGYDYTADSVRYKVQYTDSLTNTQWQSSAALVEQLGSALDNGDGTEDVTVRVLPAATTNAPCGFVRLYLELVE